MKVCVIGSGIAGLTSAAYLVKNGHEVTIFEQFNQIGGVTASFEKDGYKWDLGLLLLVGIGVGDPVGAVL